MIPNLTIEASAGTGKTYRIIQLALALLLERGIPVERLLIVTYSEKAAAELRRRLREALRAGFDARSGDSDESRGRAIALQNLDRAVITTIHSFCFRILQDFAFEAREPFGQKVDEATAVASQDGSLELVEADLRGTVPALYLENHDPKVFKYLADRDFGIPEITSVMGAYIPGITSLFPPIDAPEQVAELIRTFATTLASYRPGTQVNAQKLGSFLGLCRRIVSLSPNELWKSVSTADETAAILTKSGTVNSYVRGFAAPFTVADPGSSRKGKTAAELLEELAPFLANPVAVHVTRAVTRIAESHRLGLLEAGTINFHEMLARTRRALEQSPVLASKLRERFTAGLVDEFQDTDPLQWEIFKTIFVDQPGGGLILVGDPKQAIYGFRGADVRVFRTAFNDLKQRNLATYEQLDRNYRTDPRLVERLNRYFAGAGFPQDFSPVTSPDGGIPRRMVIAGEPETVPLRFVVPATELRGAGPTRQAHSAFIAEEIIRLLHDGIVIEEKGRTRPLEAGDICILYRTAIDARAICAELDARNLPYEQLKKERLFTLPAAREFLFLLEAVDRPDDLPTVRKALLTRFFPFTPREVEEFQGFPIRHPLQRTFGEWRRLGEEGRWACLFRGILEDSGRLLRTAREPGKEAETTELLSLARELALLGDSLQLPLGGFVRALRRQLGDQADHPSAEAVARAETERSRLQMMSIHIAKGLEFPVVFITGGFSALRLKGTPRVPDENGGWILDLSNSRKAEAERELAEEEKRLYYVALTRAVFRAYLPIHPGPTIESGGPPVQGFLRRGAEAAWPGLFADGGLTTAESDGVGIIRIGGQGEILAANDGSHGGQSKPAQNNPATEPPIPTSFGFRAWQPEVGKAGRISLHSFTLLKSRHGEHSSASSEFAPLEIASPSDTREPGDTPLAEDLMLPVPEEADQVEAGGGEEYIDDEYAELPRGARPGTLFHSLMELLDPDEIKAADSPAGLLTRAAPARLLLEDLLRRSPLRNRTTDDQRESQIRLFMQMAWRTWHAPQSLLGGKRLCDMTEIRREVDFRLPAPGTPIRELLGTRIAGGFLTGTIDLVVRHEGRILLFDYKTNRSPTSAYDPDTLREMIAEAHYDWQYLLYALALRRQCGKAPAGAGWMFTRGIPETLDRGLAIDRLDDARLDVFERETLSKLLSIGTNEGSER